jgi:hypothetical protein
MSVAAATKPLPEKKPVKFSNLLLGAGLNMYVSSSQTEGRFSVLMGK